MHRGFKISDKKKSSIQDKIYVPARLGRAAPKSCAPPQLERAHRHYARGFLSLFFSLKSRRSESSFRVGPHPCKVSSCILINGVFVFMKVRKISKPIGSYLESVKEAYAIPLSHTGSEPDNSVLPRTSTYLNQALTSGSSITSAPPLSPILL